jgi:hypothetical protein
MGYTFYLDLLYCYGKMYYNNTEVLFPVKVLNIDSVALSPRANYTD